ncbi:cyclase family protein [Sorangium cellulosum]|uniref:cyclase family protein n=1 Tax=Sorangium cellulosum TaxID=56 RepID=UPI003D9AA3C9
MNQSAASSPCDEPWVDVSVPIRDGMVHWPDNPAVEIVQTQHLERGDPATVSRLSLGVHTGTHVDAPAQFLRRGAGIDRIPLDRLIGPARVLDLGETNRIRPDHLAQIEIHPGDRVLFKTRNSRFWGDSRFRADYTYLSLDAARHLVERGIWTVGLDYLSIGDMDHGAETHRVLLAAGVCVIEGLDLSGVERGAYDLVGLPIRLEGLDGAPARIVLRRRRPEPTEVR